MCGICGFLNFNENNNNFDKDKIIKSMSSCLEHRGPDMQGFHENEFIAFGFRRLTIIDLSAKANQPLYSNDHRFILVFNGEIYNYRELKKELIKLGANFSSETDSEVIVHGYKHWGVEVLQKLRGMFAFAIWDSEEKSLFIARDHFGIKPLYYTSNTSDGSFLFSSEIKSFIQYPSFNKVLNEEAILPFLSCQYSIRQETFFRGVYKLLPGHYIKISLNAGSNQKIINIPYHQFTFDKKDRSLNENIEIIRQTIRDSVDYHMHSDVPLGTFLSGGVDSSYITSLVRPEHSFSVGFENYEPGPFDESEYAKKLANKFGIKHHVSKLSAEDCFKILPTLQYHMDEPHGNFSSVPLYFLAKLAKEYVTVVLSGEGADELFGGYETYRESRFMEQYKKLPYSLRVLNEKLSHILPNENIKNKFKKATLRPEDFYIGQMSIFKNMDPSLILNDKYNTGISSLEYLQDRYSQIRNLSELDQKQLIDLEYWLPNDILLKADKMSSAHSLELRVPFLDKEVWKIARELPENQRIHKLTTKYALRLAAEAELPQEWSQRNKLGFMVPFRNWLREEKWYKLIRDEFNSDLCTKFFNRDELLKMLDAHYSGNHNFIHEIYLPYTFLIWYKEFFVKR